eukprot:scaffold57640_cov74-Phaeocystis_antarctica.AAC.5
MELLRRQLPQMPSTLHPQGTRPAAASPPPPTHLPWLLRNAAVATHAAQGRDSRRGRMVNVRTSKRVCGTYRE